MPIENVNTGEITVIYQNGDTVHFARTAPEAIENIRSIVGGFVELVPYFNKFKGQPCQALVDEGGKFKETLYNSVATRAWADSGMQAAEIIKNGDYLVGTVVILTGAAMMD